MTVLTDNKEVAEKHRRLLSEKVSASAVIFKGAIVKIKADGFLAPMSAEVGASMAGMAYEKADNSSGADGDIDCKLLREGVFIMSGAGFTQADVGSEVFASDDQTVSTVQGANEVSVGKIAQVIDATKVYVDIAV
jgi:hypothetical protein